MNFLKILLLSLMFVSLKTKKAICPCGGIIKPKKRLGENKYALLMVYTRMGSQEGRHYEYRLLEANTSLC